MKNITEYTFDLILKINLHIVAKKRPTIIKLFILAVICTVSLFVLDYFYYSYLALFLGFVFLAGSLIMFFALLNTRRAKISQTVEKFVNNNPNQTLEYVFEDSSILIENKSTVIKENINVNYNFFTEVEKVDNETIYITAKNKTLYIIYDENGVEQYYSYLLNKIQQEV